MPLDPAFAEILLAWQTQCPASEGGWVFPNPNTGGVWHSSVLHGVFSFRWEGRSVLSVWAGIPSGIAIDRCWTSAELRSVCNRNSCGTPGEHDHAIWECLYVQYWNAYMTEKRKAHGAVVQMVLPGRREAGLKDVSA